MAEAEVDKITQVRPKAVAEIFANLGIEISSPSFKFPTGTSMPLNCSRVLAVSEVAQMTELGEMRYFDRALVTSDLPLRADLLEFVGASKRRPLRKLVIRVTLDPNVGAVSLGQTES